ncbi:hypothetical protein ACFLSA_02185 [Bacteroidota bacterium]
MFLSRKNFQVFLFVTAICTAFGFIESSVVIYLRALYYPEGFSFPLAPIDPGIALTEVIREFSTLVILLCIGFLSGSYFTTRFAYFMYAFAIWDISYYFFLKILINWPESFLTMDILFLIPSTWTGPVVAPILLSLIMIIFALFIIKFNEYQQVSIKKFEWIVLLTGAVLIVICFTYDYSRYILQEYSIIRLLKELSSKELYEYAVAYLPERFYWGIYITGTCLITGAIIYIVNRTKKEISKP